jgi:hypothetical protein
MLYRINLNWVTLELNLGLSVENKGYQPLEAQL